MDARYSKLTLAFLLLILVVPQVVADEPPEDGEEVTVWSDSSGKFKIEASFVELVDGKLVVLKRASDGKLIKVPLDKLSEKSKLEVAIAVIDTPDTKAQPKQDNDQVVDPVDKKIVQKKHQPAIKKAVGESAIRKVLGKRITINFNNAPLRQALDDIEKEAAIEIYLDNQSLNQIGIGPRSVITAAYEDDRLEDVLTSTLKDLDPEISWDVCNDVVRVTTKETMSRNLRVVVYRVIGRGDSDVLINQMQSIVEPNTWGQSGRKGVAYHYESMIVVAQTRAVHSQLAKHFRKNLRAVSSRNAWPNIQGDQKILRKISSARNRVDLVFEEEMFSEVIKRIGEKTKIQIDIDWDMIQKEFQGIDINRQPQISLNIVGMPPVSALGLVLDLVDGSLIWILKDDKILVTTLRITPYDREKAGIKIMVDLTHKFAKPVGDRFVKMIKETIYPASWNTLGGGGRISVDNTNRLVTISQTPAIHLKINKLVADLEAASR